MDYDTILCSCKEEAKAMIDAIPSEYIIDWSFDLDGRVKIYLRKGWNE